METSMQWLGNPNIIYLLLSGGLALGVLALAAPGTGVLELIAVFTLGLAGWLIIAGALPVNLWSLGVLLIGALLFGVAVRRPQRIAALVFSILALVIGSAYLFRGPNWWSPGVHPGLAAAVSVLMGGFFWLAARKAIEAEMARPSHDLTSLIGSIGEARSRIDREGTVYAGGELWTARRVQRKTGDAAIENAAPIRPEAPVRIVGREGFTLLIEPVDE